EIEEPLTRAKIAPPPPPKKRPPAYSATSMLRYETHDDRLSPNDYAYYMLLVSRAYEKDLFGSAYFLYKYDDTRHRTSADMLGIILLKAYPDSLFATIGYTYIASKAADGVPGTKTSHLSLSLLKDFPEGEGKPYVRTGVYYGAVLDEDAGDSLGLRLAYRYPFERKDYAEFSYIYAYSPDASEHMANQFGIAYFSPLRHRTRYSLEYVRSDKTFENVPSEAPDDDIFRFSLYQIH
ncbi:MAG: hypothetical protein AB1742_09940, partial [bacterium]